MNPAERIPLFDEWGHLIWTDRNEFRHHVIPQNMEADWDHAESLYAFVVQLYKDGFMEEAGRGADRLLELTDRSEEALLLKSLILMRQERDEEAKSLLQECMEQYPERGVAHTYLARIYLADSEREKGILTLREGLNREPNQESALRVLIQWQNDRDQLKAWLREWSQLEGAWWPPLELGKLLADEGHISEAMERFEQVIDFVKTYRNDEGQPAWEEEVAAMTISACLRKHGHHDELIQFCNRHWSPTYFTPFHGLDYAQSLIETGQRDRAVEVLNQMLQYVDEPYHNMVQLKVTQTEHPEARP
ncbi:tetratricopeptide repeat protein [Desmospora profundinema]|uniref:Tetratricopeptide (TPR) repeat protein n=1 Tax=Desmospora profundinema TaxID=1571184 RepID=A0ABU1IRA6_9BACL|nr:tetratricopeptide repeat protein [Desmospora profundinema]MDR6227326.1 tetratricopeptide (TPR) repeat protein [Desmospora profundinema]